MVRIPVLEKPAGLDSKMVEKSPTLVSRGAPSCYRVSFVYDGQC